MMVAVVLVVVVIKVVSTPHEKKTVRVISPICTFLVQIPPFEASFQQSPSIKRIQFQHCVD